MGWSALWPTIENGSQRPQVGYETNGQKYPKVILLSECSWSLRFLKDKEGNLCHDFSLSFTH